MALNKSQVHCFREQRKRDFKNHLLGSLSLARPSLSSQYGCPPTPGDAPAYSDCPSDKEQSSALCVLLLFSRTKRGPPGSRLPPPPTPPLGLMLFLLSTVAALTKPIRRGQPRSGRKRVWGQTAQHARLFVSGADGDWHSHWDSDPWSLESGWGRPSQGSGHVGGVGRNQMSKHFPHLYPQRDPTEPSVWDCPGAAGVSVEEHRLWPRIPIVLALWREHPEVKPRAMILASWV